MSLYQREHNSNFKSPVGANLAATVFYSPNVSRAIWKKAKIPKNGMYVFVDPRVNDLYDGRLFKNSKVLRNPIGPRVHSKENR